MIVVQDVDRLYTTLTQEEYEAVLTKMQSFVQRPAGHLEKEEELYLDQQLTDMLGFEVSAEYEGTRLAQSMGVMTSLPHLRRHPTDTLDTHDTYREAGLADRRSSFGWFTELGQLTPAAIQREKYSFAVHADFLPAWQKETTEQKNWWKYRKMVMINPFVGRAVVGVVGDLGPANWLQAQFGGSPEVIREGEVWNLVTQGRVLLFFINDPEDQIALGSRQLVLQ